MLNKNPIKYYRLPKRFRSRIVHYHHARWVHLVATALGKHRSQNRYIVTFHAGQIGEHSPLTSKNLLIRRINRWALGHFDTVIAVDASIASAIKGYLDRQRIEVLPAFVDASNDRAEGYEPAIEAFFRAGRVVVVSAYAVQFLDNRREVYGLDNAVEAFANIASDHEDLRLAIFIARRPTRSKARRHLARLERRLEAAGLSDRTLVVFGQPLVPALRRNAIYVRPTRAEGDAVSVREAQAAGVRVIASNVVRRPPGVMLFETGDVAALSDALLTALGDSVPSGEQPGFEPGRRSVNGDVNEFAARLIVLYREELVAQAHASG